MEIIRHSPALVRVHNQSLGHLICSSSEGGEEENPGLVSEDSASHELFSREVHPVPQWENQGDVCVSVESGQLCLLQRPGDQNHRPPTVLTEPGIDGLHLLLEELEDLGPLLVPGGHTDLVENYLQTSHSYHIPPGTVSLHLVSVNVIFLQQSLEGGNSVIETLGVVQSVHTDHHLHLPPAAHLKVCPGSFLC